MVIDDAVLAHAKAMKPAQIFAERSDVAMAQSQSRDRLL